MTDNLIKMCTPLGSIKICITKAIRHIEHEKMAEAHLDHSKGFNDISPFSYLYYVKMMIQAQNLTKNLLQGSHTSDSI